MSAAPEFIRVIDTNGREHFIHPTTIADAHVTQDTGAQPHVEIVTTARNTNPNLGDRPQSVHVSGPEAEHLLAELRWRAGVGDPPQINPAPTLPPLPEATVAPRSWQRR